MKTGESPYFLSCDATFFKSSPEMCKVEAEKGVQLPVTIEGRSHGRFLHDHKEGSSFFTDKEKLKNLLSLMIIC